MCIGIDLGGTNIKGGLVNSEGIILEDMGSKNGTHRNGDALSAPVVLQDGDMIQVSLAQEFTFLTSDSTMPLGDGVGRPGRLMMDLRSRRVWVNQVQLVPPLSAGGL